MKGVKHNLVFSWGITVLLFATANISCSSQFSLMGNIDSLVNSTHSKRTIQLTPFYEMGIGHMDSVDFFNRIEFIENLAKSNGDRGLEMEAMLIRAHYFHYNRSFSKEFTVKKIKELETIAKQENVLWLEIRAQNLLANYYYSFHNDYGLGFEHYERTAQLLEKVSSSEFPLKKICLYQLGKVYFEFREYKNAIKYFVKSKDAKSPLYNYYYETLNYNFLANSYIKVKKIDSAKYYFDIILDKAIEVKDTIWEGITSGDLGNIYLLEGNLAKAKPLLEKNLRIAKSDEDWRLVPQALIQLSKIELIESNIDMASVLVDEAYNYVHGSDYYFLLEEIFLLKSKIASYKGNPQLAANYLDSTLVVKDSLSKLFDIRKLIRAKQRIENEKQRLKEVKEQQNQLNRIWVRNATILFLVLFTVIILLIYVRYRLKVKNKLQKIIIEKQLAIQKLENANNKLVDFQNSMIEKNKEIEALEKNLKNSNESKNTEPSVSQKQLEEASLLTDKHWREFTQLFEEVHAGFFDRLKKKYPNLTASEVRFMALSRLKLGNKEMALMLGIGTSAIRQIKSRLHKKIETPDSVSIQELALAI